MRALSLTLFMGFLAACAPSLPDSGAGAGFSNSDQVQLARENALNTGQPLVPPSVISNESTSVGGVVAQPTVLPVAPTGPAPPVVVSEGSPEDIAAATALALGGTGAAPHPATPTGATPNNAGISDENDFRAVSERETIESDAARIAANRAQYQVIAPTAVPTRSGPTQPNIVDYALSTTNPRGSSIYKRSGVNTAARAVRSCAKFASPDLAQTAFLSKGGPQKDRQGLDPDGDGYACSWDPAPFRRAVSN